MSGNLSREEMEAIATVVARLARGRGTWFDAMGTVIHFGKIAEQNLGFRSQVMDAAAKVRTRSSRTVDWDLRRLEQTADELAKRSQSPAARGNRSRR